MNAANNARDILTLAVSLLFYRWLFLTTWRQEGKSKVVRSGIVTIILFFAALVLGLVPHLPFDVFLAALIAVLLSAAVTLFFVFESYVSNLRRGPS